MSSEDKVILDRINEYADRVLKDFDPQKTRVSFQLEKLRPIMEEIAKEKGVSLEEIFIKYMDLVPFRFRLVGSRNVHLVSSAFIIF